MADIKSKFGLGGGGGIHFSDPWELWPARITASLLFVYDSAGTARNSTTTNFFTEMARRGVQEQTNWTADTYKTIANISGKGLFAGYVGCTAGGVETHTLEVTVDGGTAVELAFDTMASGERAFLGVATMDSLYTLADNFYLPGGEALDANKDTFDHTGSNRLIAPWSVLTLQGTPLLKFETSLLIRAKHSANITNSTATAYSAVMYRKGL